MEEYFTNSLFWAAFLASTVRLTIPILMGAAGEVLAERSGDFEHRRRGHDARRRIFRRPRVFLYGLAVDGNGVGYCGGLHHRLDSRLYFDHGAGRSSRQRCRAEHSLSRLDRISQSAHFHCLEQGAVGQQV